MKIINNAVSWADDRSWRTYNWPIWVPASVKVQVEDIWPSPTEWERNSAAVNAPQLGEPISALATSELIPGRYVHMRNTVGRIVTDLGQVLVIELDRPWPRVQQRPRRVS